MHAAGFLESYKTLDVGLGSVPSDKTATNEFQSLFTVYTLITTLLQYRT